MYRDRDRALASQVEGARRGRQSEQLSVDLNRHGFGAIARPAVDEQVAATIGIGISELSGE
jgi:hypothetical protein